MDKETDAIFDCLIAMRDELLTLSAAASENRKPVALDQQSVGRLTRMDSLQVQAMDMAQDTARRKAVVRIDGALARLTAGDYGFCAKCGDPISGKRLALDAATPLCIGCAK